jgi:preprotein translocase SecE subunit
MPTLRNENEMAANIVVAPDEPEDDADDSDSKSSSELPSKAPTPSRAASSKGFFTIYKRGQGKWTRLGTIFVALLLGVLTAVEAYQYIIPYLPTTADASHDRAVKQILLGGCVLFFIGFCLLVYWLTNKPGNVDFLIATDSEMKKVNWTTRGELFGSTRVVVLFLFFIAIFLFIVDFLFAEFFRLIHVLQ